MGELSSGQSSGATVCKPDLFPFFKSILGSFKVSQNIVSSMFHPHSIFLANMQCPFAEVVGQGIERSICLAPAEAHVDLEYLDTLNY